MGVGGPVVGSAGARWCGARGSVSVWRASPAGRRRSVTEAWVLQASLSSVGVWTTTFESRQGPNTVITTARPAPRSHRCRPRRELVTGPVRPSAAPEQSHRPALRPPMAPSSCLRVRLRAPLRTARAPPARWTLPRARPSPRGSGRRPSMPRSRCTSPAPADARPPVLRPHSCCASCQARLKASSPSVNSRAFQLHKGTRPDDRCTRRLPGGTAPSARLCLLCTP